MDHVGPKWPCTVATTYRAGVTAVHAAVEVVLYDNSMFQARPPTQPITLYRLVCLTASVITPKRGTASIHAFLTVSRSSSSQPARYRSTA